MTDHQPVYADGRRVPLHDLLGYHRWTLLLPAARADAATRSRLRAACAGTAAAVETVPVHVPDRADARQLGGGDRMLLVRPDGYVALVTAVDQADVLRAYLRTFLPVPTTA